MYFRKANDVFQLKIIRYALEILRTVSHEKLTFVSKAQWQRICRNARKDTPHYKLKSVVDLLVDYGAMKVIPDGRYVFESSLHVYICVLESLLNERNALSISSYSLTTARNFGIMWRNARCQCVGKNAFNDRCLRFRKSQRVPIYVMDSALDDLFASGCLKSQETSIGACDRIRSRETKFYHETFRRFFSLPVIKECTQLSLLDLEKKVVTIGLERSSVEGHKRTSSLSSAHLVQHDDGKWENSTTQEDPALLAKWQEYLRQTLP